MTDWVGYVLKRYGQETLVRTPTGDLPVKAFLQPITKENEQVMDSVTALGWIDGRLWLYLGRMVLSPGDRVVWNDYTFRVRSCRPYYIGQELTPYWAVLEQAKEAAT